MATSRKGRKSVRASVEESEENPGREAATTGNVFDVAAHDGHRASVHRRDDYTKKFVFHGYLTPTESTEAKVAELFGGGDYRLQLRGPDELGREVIRQTRDFRVPGPYKPPTGALPGVSPTVATQQPSPSASSNGEGSSNVREMFEMTMAAKVMDVMRMSSQMQPPKDDGFKDVLLLMMKQQQDSAIQMQQMMLAQQASMVEFMKVMMGSRPDVSMSDILKLVTERTGNSDVTALIRGMKELKSLSEDAPEGTGDPILDSVPKVLGLIEQGMHARGAPVATPDNRPSLPPSTAPLWQQLLLSQRRTILGVAARGSDPEWAASAALQLMPEQYVGVLREFVAMPEHVGLATQTIPELGNFPQWTQRFFAALVAEMSDDVTPDDAEVDDEVAP